MIHSASGKFHPPDHAIGKCVSPRIETEEHPCCDQTPATDCVIHRRVFDRLTLRIGSAHGARSEELAQTLKTERRTSNVVFLTSNVVFLCMFAEPLCTNSLSFAMRSNYVAFA
jgi:hypothetical protein